MLRLLKRRQSLWGRVRAKFGEEEQIQRLSAIALLAGEPRSQLEARAREFIATVDAIQPTVELLEAAKAKGNKVVLVSSSLDVVVAAVAERFQVDGYFASTLKFDDDVCLGELDEDLLGNKAALIDQEFGTAHTTFVTDNFSDADCVDVVNKLYPVYRRGNTRAQAFWRRRTTEPPICYD